MADWLIQRSGKGVLVSGGAPNLHLAAGALCAFYEHQVSFDLIGAAGAGALPGLLYAVPKNNDPVAALRSTVYMNVHDLIYAAVSDNFKVFFKRGPFTEPFWRLGRLLPRFPLTAADRDDSSGRRFFNDLVDLTVAVMTPSTLWYGSPSVCTRVGVIDDVIDWDKLHEYPKDFFLNTFDLGKLKLKTFDKTGLTPQSFYAALAMPWLYEPTVVGDRIYTEGAAHDPSGLEALWKAFGIGGQDDDDPSPQRRQRNPPNVDMLIALDTVVTDVWLDPGNIQEALELAVMDPIVSLSEYVLALYSRLEFFLPDSQRNVPKIYYVPFPIPAKDASRILDWSYSNAVSLWDIGHKAADDFCKVMKRNPNDLETYRYYRVRRNQPLVADFLKLFDDLLPG